MPSPSQWGVPQFGTTQFGEKEGLGGIQTARAFIDRAVSETAEIDRATSRRARIDRVVALPALVSKRES